MLQDMQKDFEIKKIKRSACKMKEPHSHPFHELPLPRMRPPHKADSP